MKFDPSRNFVQIIGASRARYFQDGYEFDQQGELIPGQKPLDQEQTEPQKRRGRPPKEKSE